MLRKCALVVCLFACGLWAQQEKIAGEWAGVIAGKLHIVVRIVKGDDHSLHGSLESIDQGHAKIDIESVTLDPKGVVELNMKQIGAIYQAEFNDAGTELIGTWQQGGSMAALNLRRTDAPALKPLEPATRGHIAFQPCPDSDGQSLCGSYEVWENRASKSGRKIPLHIMLLPALAEKPAADPIFAFAGGPGQSAAEAYPALTTIAALRKKRDIVLLDQRGTGQSNPLPCPVELND